MNKDRESITDFSFVDNYGHASSYGASHSLSIRPVFKLKNC